MNEQATTTVTVDEHHDDHHHEHPKGFIGFIKRWVFTTNHKEIGALYLWTSLVLFFVAGAMAMLIRAELFSPGARIMDPELFNTMTTMHGLVMVFGAIMPALTGFANYQVPLMIGASDMAFPRMNNWSFWIIPFAAIILFSTVVPAILSWLFPGVFGPAGAAPNFGWTMYAPLSTTYGPPSTDYVIFAVHLLGLSSIMGSINIIVTILTMRAPGMTLMKMPLFVWTWLITAFLIIAVMPVLAGTVTMMLADRHFGTSFFEAAGGGDPLLYQHLFWFFGHPEVYILILPVFGIISQVISAFSRKPIFGYACMVYATASIAILSFIVWAHHMFVSGIPAQAEIYFMYATMLIAVPTGVKVFNWVSTMWKGSISFETPMLFAIAFVVLFTIGGFTGLMLSIAPSDHQYHDSYFVVAHFHYVLGPGVLFGIFSGIYFWYPKWTGRMMNETLGKIHFWISLVSLNVTFFPMHFLGLAGMPRRIPDYALQFTDFNMLASMGGIVFGLTQLIFAYNLIASFRKGKKAEARPWDGAKGLEWTLPSPAPLHSFSTPPKFDDKEHL